MKNFRKIVGVNLLILLSYSVLLGGGIYFTETKSGNGYAGLSYLYFMAFVIGLQVLVNLIIAIIQFVKGEKGVGQSYLLSLFVVAIVGFSSCLGGAELL